MRYTPGTIGGIKVDGTTFHHGGFYPAYTTGALAMLGQFINLTNKTSYQLTLSARKVLKSALIAMRNYCNKYEWGVGISGRHPFGGSMKDDDIDAFAYLALSGDFSDKGEPFDHQLAADYLRLCKRNTPEAAYFKQQGILPATAPQGFLYTITVLPAFSAAITGWLRSKDITQMYGERKFTQKTTGTVGIKVTVRYK